MTISNIATYHRPDDLKTALRLLQKGKGRVVPLAGGTDLLGRPPSEVAEVVDLRNLRLDGVRPEEDGTLSIGATTTLSRLMSDEAIEEYAGGVLAQAARYSAGSLVRNRATVGGTLIARMATSDLVAVLLAVGTSVVVVRDNEEEMSLEEFYRHREKLLQPGSLLTEVRLPALPHEASISLERIARTPLDQPILTVAALVSTERARVAVNAFGDRPAVMEVDQSELQDEKIVEGLDIKNDHLASGTYRRAMLPILVRRALHSRNA